MPYSGEAARAAAGWGTASATVFGPAANKVAGIAGNTAANLGGSAGARSVLRKIAEHTANIGANTAENRAQEEYLKRLNRAPYPYRP